MVAWVPWLCLLRVAQSPGQVVRAEVPELDEATGRAAGSTAKGQVLEKPVSVVVLIPRHVVVCRPIQEQEVLGLERMALHHWPESL